MPATDTESSTVTKIRTAIKTTKSRISNGLFPNQLPDFVSCPQTTSVIAQDLAMLGVKWVDRSLPLRWAPTFGRGPLHESTAVLIGPGAFGKVFRTHQSEALGAEEQLCPYKGVGRPSRMTESSIFLQNLGKLNLEAPGEDFAEIERRVTDAMSWATWINALNIATFVISLLLCNALRMRKLAWFRFYRSFRFDSGMIVLTFSRAETICGCITAVAFLAIFPLLLYHRISRKRAVKQAFRTCEKLNQALSDDRLPSQPVTRFDIYLAEDLPNYSRHRIVRYVPGQKRPLDCEYFIRYSVIPIDGYNSFACSRGEKMSRVMFADAEKEDSDWLENSDDSSRSEGSELHEEVTVLVGGPFLGSKSMAAALKSRPILGRF